MSMDFNFLKASLDYNCTSFTIHYKLFKFWKKYVFGHMKLVSQPINIKASKWAGKEQNCKVVFTARGFCLYIFKIHISFISLVSIYFMIDVIFL